MFKRLLCDPPSLMQQKVEHFDDRIWQTLGRTVNMVQFFLVFFGGQENFFLPNCASELVLVFFAVWSGIKTLLLSYKNQQSDNFSDCSHKTNYIDILPEILNLEGHSNHCIGSKVTTILLNGWILPIGWAASGRVCVWSLRSRLVSIHIRGPPPPIALIHFYQN